MSGYFVVSPPKIEITEDKIFKNKKAKELIQDIPRTLSKETQNEIIKTLNLTIHETRAGNMVKKETVSNLAKRIVEEVIANHDNTLLNLMDIRNHDEYTFTHSINVCLLSTLMGVKKKLSRAELEDLTIGALLHDVGKIMVPEKILNKPANLNSVEIAEIQRHPFHSYNILLHDNDMGGIIRTIAYEHHERCDGSGYPRKLPEKDIHPFVHIVSIADVYDALTTDRPYRKSLLPHDALRIIISQSTTGFPMETLRVFLRYLSIYPLGSLVQLNTGEVGLVVKVNKESIVRPTIRLLINSKGKMLSPNETEDIELKGDTHRFILYPVGEEVFGNK